MHVFIKIIQKLNSAKKLGYLHEVMGENVHEFDNNYGEEKTSTLRNPSIDDEAEKAVPFEPDDERQ